MIAKLQQRSVALTRVVAVLFFAVVTAFNLLPGIAKAEQITQRSIVLSDSAPGTVTTASNGSDVATGNNVTYSLRFTTATTHAIKGIVISFCDNTPFLADTNGCTAVTGFVVGNGTGLVVTGLSGTYDAAQGTSNHVVVITNSTATSTPAGTAVTVAIPGFKNPSSPNHTFYARILTYTDNTVAANYVDSTPGAYTDYGGVALSTSNVIKITARVMETLSFCVFDDPPATGCGLVTGNDNAAPNLILGHGSNNTLDALQVDRAKAYSQVSTNAASGVIIRLVNSNKCGGLSRVAYASQSSTAGCDIPPVNYTTGGTTAAPAAIIAPSTAGFGVNVYDLGIAKIPAGTGPGAGSGTVTPEAPYYDSTYTDPTTPATKFGMAHNLTSDTSHPGVSSTYGDPVAKSTAPVSNINTQYTFGAQASDITPSGIYTANISLIATGTY